MVRTACSQQLVSGELSPEQAELRRLSSTLVRISPRLPGQRPADHAVPHTSFLTLARSASDAA